ncbi:MAG: PEP-CTERM sorting domain-containing protein [Phycisphaerae bacterium]|nr:PEP-CTERM sorting domain-containing protein [Phycisphaerae bacterium]
MRTLRAAAAVAALFLGSLAAHAEALYTIADLGPLGATNDGVYASAVNNGGEVVGFTEDRAFLWQNGQMTDLVVLPGRNRAHAFDINNSGQVVGWSYKYTSLHGVPISATDGRGFLWEKGTMTDLGILAAVPPPYPPEPNDPNRFSSALGVNDAGQIVGTCGRTVILGGVLLSPERAFVWEGGTMQALNDLIPPDPSWDLTFASAINNTGQIVGSTMRTGPAVFRGFLFSGGSVTDLGTLGGESATGTDVNNAGQAVGYSDSAAGSDLLNHPFLWQDGTIADLGVPPGGSSLGAYATAINASGVIVGWAGTGSPPGTACLWSEGAALDLNALIAPDSDWQLMYASDINDLGQIVGYGSHKIAGEWYERAFILTPIPEPATVALLLAGGLALLRRRRKTT